MIFAHKIAKVPFAKNLLKPFYYPYKNRIERKRNATFRKNALEVLSAFDEAMTGAGYRYVLMFGSMLGAIREKGFLAHDLDIDTGFWAEDYDEDLIPTLERAGFRLVHTYTIDDGRSAREQTVERDGVTIDLYYIYPALDEYPYVCSKWRPVGSCANVQESMRVHGYITGKRLELPMDHSIVRVPFENLFLPVPGNAHEVMRFYYGDDYMNPDPKWQEASSYPYRKPWPEKKAVYQEF